MFIGGERRNEEGRRGGTYGFGRRLFHALCQLGVCLLVSRWGDEVCGDGDGVLGQALPRQERLIIPLDPLYMYMKKGQQTQA